MCILLCVRDRLTHIVPHAPSIDFNLTCRLMFATIAVPINWQIVIGSHVREKNDLLSGYMWSRNAWNQFPTEPITDYISLSDDHFFFGFATRSLRCISTAINSSVLQLQPWHIEILRDILSTLQIVWQLDRFRLMGFLLMRYHTHTHLQRTCK